MNQLPVPAYISNISAPKTPDQLFNFMYQRGEYDVEALFHFESIDWTAPKWATTGSIVFYMHAAHAYQSLNAVIRQLDDDRQKYSQREYDDAMAFIQHGKKLHKQYGGRIFAIARVLGSPTHYDDEIADPHYWRSRVYAQVGNFFILDNPVGIEEFRSFITVARQSSITPVVGSDFDQLRNLVIAKNDSIPGYLKDAVASPMTLSKITENNWLEISRVYRHSFFLEIQFRKYYVDYFLSVLGDQKSIIREARVQKLGMNDSFVDNIILFNGKFLPVEVKLNIHAEADLTGQLEKYCNCDAVFRDSGVEKKIDIRRVYSNCVLVVDTEAVYLYDDRKKTIVRVYDLDSIKSRDNISLVREKLIRMFEVL